ncbi:hypothetical protein BDW74DRAFT_182740 [Aspergillus multicolor]|uniref:uncharacterized protein n=1 Tax=Aspergillus multicolor TaxID=41759 RepID=UPI003CCD96A8
MRSMINTFLGTLIIIGLYITAVSIRNQHKNFAAQLKDLRAQAAAGAATRTNFYDQGRLEAKMEAAQETLGYVVMFSVYFWALRFGRGFYNFISNPCNEHEEPGYCFSREDEITFYRTNPFTAILVLIGASLNLYIASRESSGCAMLLLSTWSGGI